MWYIGQQAAAARFNTDFIQIVLVALRWRRPLSPALIVRFLTKRFIGDYEANTGEFPFTIYRTRQRKQPERVLDVPCTIHPFHSSACAPLSFSTGALYSRKVTLEGEEVSLQIQDTPCVALQVTNGRRRSGPRMSRGQKKARRCFCWAKRASISLHLSPSQSGMRLKRGARFLPAMALMSATCHTAHPAVYKTKAAAAHFLRRGKDNGGQRKSPLEGWWVSERLERNNQRAEAQRSRWSPTSGRFQRRQRFYGSVL